eukprot:13130553-Alexandrium_andersonii.AAC.1
MAIAGEGREEREPPGRQRRPLSVAHLEEAAKGGRHQSTSTESSRALRGPGGTRAARRAETAAAV